MYDEAVQIIECRSMVRGIGTTIPKKYLSRRTSFYEVVHGVREGVKVGREGDK